jgi:hypothetical protein
MLPTLVLIATLAPSRAEPTVPPPTFATGDEMVYAGDVAEESTRIDVPYKRAFALEVRVFVLAASATHTDLAVMTLLRPKEDPNVAGPAAAVTGIDPAKNRTPPAVRLELIRVDATGQPALLVPGTSPPFALTAKTPTKPAPAVPLDGPAALELGYLVPRPDKVTVNSTWKQKEKDRPDAAWSAAQAAVLNGAQVLELAGTQQTAKWANPGGLEANWRRTDSVWVATADGLARQFTRTIEIKDGVHVVEKRTVRCTLTTPPTPNRGDGYSAIRKEVEAAVSFAAELDAGRATRLLERLDVFEQRHRETPYRAALEAVRRRVK